MKRRSKFLIGLFSAALTFSALTVTMGTEHWHRGYYHGHYHEHSGHWKHHHHGDRDYDDHRDYEGKEHEGDSTQGI